MSKSTKEDDYDNEPPQISPSTLIGLRILDRATSTVCWVIVLLACGVVIKWSLVPLASSISGRSTSFSANLSFTFTATLAMSNGLTYLWGRKHKAEAVRLADRNRTLQKRLGAERSRSKKPQARSK